MTQVPDVERGVGMLAYASGGEPCAAKARVFEGDFVVEEGIVETGLVKEHRPGYFPLYRVEKHGIDTMHMEKEIADVLKSRVSYAGLKDKRAVAVQFVTPTSIRGERPERIEKEKFSATLVGYVPKPLTKGSVAKNKFRVVLRDCCPGIGGSADEVFRLAEKRKLPNFYGLQRFGVRGVGTHRLGKAIVKGDFKGAVGLLLTGSHEGDVEGRVADYLQRKPGDWLGAIRAVPIKLRRLYTQAFQSHIFNLTLSIAMEEDLDFSRFEAGDNWSVGSDDGFRVSSPHGVKEPAPDGAVPVVQFAGYSFRNYGSRFDRCLMQAMEQEGVEAREFYVKEMQEVSVEGGFRIPSLTVKEASFKSDLTASVLEFVLGRGQYATTLLREIIKGDPVESGLA